MSYGALTEKLEMGDLLRLYNFYADKPIKKFSDTATARKRTLAVLEIEKPLGRDMIEFAKLSPVGAATVDELIADPVKVIKAAKSPFGAMAPKPETTKSDPVPRPEKKVRKKGLNGNRNKGKLLYRNKPEKLRQGSRRQVNFEKITDGMTYEQYQAKGGNVADLSIMIRYDIVLAKSPEESPT